MNTKPEADMPAAAAAPRLAEPALARLRELDPDGRHGVVERVLQAFESSLVRALPRLAEAIECADAAAMQSVAHMLKSSSASVGALGLAEASTALELGARAGPSPELAPLAQRMLAEGERALVAVRAFLADPGRPASR